MPDQSRSSRSGQIVDGCQIHGPMPYALLVTETPVEVKQIVGTGRIALDQERAK